MRLTKHLVTTVVVLATVITITFPISALAQGTSLETYRNADLGYTIDYPSDWEASDSLGILGIDSPKDSLAATLQVMSLADDTDLGEFSDGRVQNVEAVTRNVDMAVYEDTEFGGNDAEGIKYKLNGKTVYLIWTIEDDKAYVLTINIKNSDMTSTLLNQANQIKDSFRLLHTDSVTSVNSESSDDDDDDDDNNNNENGNGRDIVVEEEKTIFEIDNTIKNTVTSTDTDSDTEKKSDTGTDSLVEIDNTIKNTVTSTDTDSDSEKKSDLDKGVDCDKGQDFVKVLGVCKDSKQVDRESEAEENNDKNSNDNGNKHGNDNGNKHGK